MQKGAAAVTGVNLSVQFTATSPSTWDDWTIATASAQANDQLKRDLALGLRRPSLGDKTLRTGVC
jgi:hypothetical protein